MIKKKWEQRIVNEWFRDNGNINLRLGHDLNSDSIVFDVGGYTGEGAQRIWDKFHCNIYSFEPVFEFYEILSNRFSDIEKVQCFPYGLAPKTEQLYMSADADAASYVNGGDKLVQVYNIYKFFTENEIDKVDLLEMNIEGAEFDLLECMLDTELHLRVDNLQIQFHDVIPDAYDRMVSIQNRLSETHDLTYQYLFCFENWKLKKIESI